MRRARARSFAVVAAVAVLAAACGNNRSSSGSTTTAGGATSTTVAAGAGIPFGTGTIPCGPAKAGAANTASDQGVTATTITIGAGDDRGFASTPGLNKEMTEAVQADAAACNKAGGINGRQIVVKTYDAAVLAVQKAMTQACSDKLFFLVGEGFALDSNQEETRLGCQLPAVPGYSVSAAFANAPMMYQSVPNPADKIPAVVAQQLAKLYPTQITKAGTLAGNFSATQETRDKVVQAYPKFGFKFLPNSQVEYPVQGQTEDAWGPTLKQLQSAGVQLLYWSGSCQPLQPAMREARVIGFKAIWQTDTNHYDSNCAKSNTDGAMDGLLIRTAFVPFEEASYNKATADFLKLMADANPPVPVTQLGEQATSSFILWATAAASCGANLTRQCVLDAMGKVHSWTGLGMHAQTDPGSNLPPQCGILLELKGTKYIRVAPTKPDTFDCDPNSVVDVDTPAVKQAMLDSNRIAHQFQK